MESTLRENRILSDKESPHPQNPFDFTFECLRYRTIEVELLRMAMIVTLGRSRSEQIFADLQQEIDETYVRNSEASTDVKEIPYIQELFKSAG